MNGICYYLYRYAQWGSVVTWPVNFYTATMTNSWTFLDQGWPGKMPYDQQSWTVTTITGFYAMFPLLLPQLQTFSTPRLSSLIIILFYLQCLPLYVILLDMDNPYNGWFWPATAHPLSRLPVFVMGMAAGLIRLRGESNLGVSPAFLNFLHDLVPWHFWPSADDIR